MSHASHELSQPPLLAQPDPVTSDETLMEQVATGDREAFAMLYDRVASGVYGMARHVLADAATAEDVTQDVLATVWSGAGSFDRATGSARTWIMTMAHRRAVAVVRSEHAARTVAERSRAEASHKQPFVAVADAGAEALVDHSRGSDVDQALHSLTVLQRSAVDLAFFKGLTCPQVAQVLEVPLETVRMRMREGLRHLGVQLGTTGPAPG